MSRDPGGTGRGSAVTILVLVLLAFTALAAVIAFAVAVSDQPTSVFDLETGDCFVLPIDGGDTLLEQVDPISCDQPHDAEVIDVGEINADRNREYPTDDALFAEVDAKCAAVAVPTEFGRLPIAPDDRSWTVLGGRYLCLAIPFGGDLVTAPISEF